MADINLSDITGVPVLMPVVRDWQDVPSPAQPTGIGAGSGSYSYYRFCREGPNARIQFFYTKDATVGTGSTDVSWPVAPEIGRVLRTTIQPAGARTFGIAHTQPASSLQVNASTTASGSVIGVSKMGTAGGLKGSDMAANSTVVVDMVVPITGWETHEAIGTGVATAERAGLLGKGLFEKISTTLSGATTSPAMEIAVSRLNDEVTLTISPSGTVTKNGTAGPYSFVAVIPAFYRPTAQLYLPVITGNGVVLMLINTSGNIYIFQSGTGTNIPAGNATSGWTSDIAVSYNVR